MRITGLEVQGFRGFAGSHRLDLDANAVVIVGANGQGKTSLFDAILWALTGNVPRIKENALVVSMYSETGGARVTLNLREPDGREWAVTRLHDGAQEQFRVEHDGRVLQGAAAFTELLEMIWPDGLLTGDGAGALTAALTRSVYMQQDLIRQFIDADNEQDRFAAVGELVGAGRVTELQVQLERAKAAWSRATNAKSKDIEAAQQRVARLEDQRRRLGRSDGAPRELTDEAWGQWWVSARECGVEGSPDIGMTSPEASQALDAAIRQLEVHRRATDRRRNGLASALQDLIEEPHGPVGDNAALLSALSEAEGRRAFATEALGAAQSRAAELRRAQLALKEAKAQLCALAEIALKHLGAQCPVCAQEYDADATRVRLVAILDSGTDVEGVGTRDGESDVSLAAELVGWCEQEVRSAHSALRTAEDVARRWNDWIVSRDRRMQELGVATAGDARMTLERALSDADAGANRLSGLQELGERMALTLARSAELVRRGEIDRELVEARKELANLGTLISEREATGELAGQVILGLREATSDVVREQLLKIEPLLQRIYSGIDPHPAFRAVRLLTHFSRGRGHLAAQLSDEEARLRTSTPEAVLSSSQMNALAVSIFLALNLGVPRLPLRAVLLDDPLQSLDDVNLLGLVDLLRRVKDQRQIIVSTHDSRFGRLLARKLRPANGNQRACVIELDAWGRDGQSVTQSDVEADPAPLRIVA